MDLLKDSALGIPHTLPLKAPRRELEERTTKVALVQLLIALERTWYPSLEDPKSNLTSISELNG